MSILKAGTVCCAEGLRLLVSHFQRTSMDINHLQDMGLNFKDIGSICWKNEPCPGCGAKVKIPYVRKQAYDRLYRKLRHPTHSKRLKSFVEED